MSRHDLVKEFNYYTNKRDSYIEKKRKNEELISAIEDGFANCSNNVDQLSSYADYANIFTVLRDRSESYFNAEQKEYIIGILNEVQEHLEGERASAQQQINYWYNQMVEYDREQEEQAQQQG